MAEGKKGMFAQRRRIDLIGEFKPDIDSINGRPSPNKNQELLRISPREQVAGFDPKSGALHLQYI